MNRQRFSLLLTSLVIGLTTITSVSANQSSIEDSVNKAVAEQTKQVSQQISKALKDNIQAQLKLTIALADKPVVHTEQMIAQVSPSSKRTIEEE
ncbi:hypothetical protein [Thalassotalea hakodatensis]|uniref:hypothetical protein n=1 Tax=Thalassotalea hakodatensis TaxID=3030492 RepID=UPI0025746B03|nr:hypothetical protein [Thalassotalea hakodatensis]